MDRKPSALDKLVDEIPSVSKFVERVEHFNNRLASMGISQNNIGSVVTDPFDSLHRAKFRSESKL